MFLIIVIKCTHFMLQFTEYEDWKLEEQFVVLALQPALDFDSYKKHALNGKINNSSDIFEMFDTISYNKGLYSMHRIKV